MTEAHFELTLRRRADFDSCLWRSRHLVASALWTLSAAVTFLSMLSIPPFSETATVPGGIELALGLPLGCTVLSFAYVVFLDAGLLQLATPDLRRARFCFGTGVGSFGVATIAWNLVENDCRAVPDGYKAVGHVLWHVLGAYGLHCLVVLLCLLRAPLSGLSGSFLRGAGPVARACFLTLPVPVVRPAGLLGAGGAAAQLLGPGRGPGASPFTPVSS